MTLWLQPYAEQQDHLIRYGQRRNNASSGINIPGSVSAPSASISEMDMQNTQQHIVTASGNNKTVSKTFNSSKVDYTAVQQTIPKADINATMKANVTENGQTTAKGTKSASAASKTKGPQKSAPVNPAQPGPSLPIGDGTWVLLFLLAGYRVTKRVSALLA